MASVPRPAAAAHSAAGGATPAGTAAHPDIHAHRILILDFGAQYTQLIARRVRELGVYCEIHPWDMGDAGVRAFGARGVILSGGPETVTTASAPRAPDAIYELGVPVLGICYGMQTMAQQLGGRVEAGKVREFGYAEVRARGHTRLLDGIDRAAHRRLHGVDPVAQHAAEVARLEAEGLVETSAERLRLTPRGVLFADEVGARFV